MGLLTRYPELAYILNLYPIEKRGFCEWPIPKITLRAARVLYVFGTTVNLEPFHEYLEKHPDSEVVFIEDDLFAIHQMQVEGKKGFFSDTRMHLRLFLEQDVEEFATKIAGEFPSEKIGFIDFKRGVKHFEAIKTLLLRRSTLANAVQTEVLCYHKLYDNLKPNFLRISESFNLSQWHNAFANIPAIVCGAGPSLSTIQEKLQAQKGKALIFAGGSTITALNAMNITPDLAFAVDPNEEEFTRLMFHTSHDTPLIYMPRVQPDIFSTHAGPIGYLAANCGGPIEAWLQEELKIQAGEVLKGLSEEAMSVTCIAVRTAVFLGCNPIVFAGIDLSFAQGKRYAEGVISALHTSLEVDASEIRYERGGKETTIRWIMEADVLAKIAAQFPDRSFIDGSGVGLPIEGVTVCKDFASNWHSVYDLKSMVHERVIQSSFPITREEIENKLREFTESMIRVEGILRELVEQREMPRYRKILLESDLEGEIAYKLALKNVMRTNRCTLKNLLEIIPQFLK